jgi:hypothetical protein
MEFLLLQMSQACEKDKDEIKECVLARKCINNFWGKVMFNVCWCCALVAQPGRALP